MVIELHDLKEVGFAIYKIRTDKNMTLGELGKRTGITKGTLSAFENGNITKLSLTKLTEISKALEMDLKFGFVK